MTYNVGDLIMTKPRTSASNYAVFIIEIGEFYTKYHFICYGGIDSFSTGISESMNNNVLSWISCGTLYTGVK